MSSKHRNFELSPSIFQRNPKTSILLILMISFLLIIALTEIALRIFTPIPLSNVGFVNTPNGLRFGWGFEPYGLVRIESPDTGKVSADRVNSKGWRDRDRTYENPDNAFRVIVLGDSQTFGFIVPKEKTFTWVLEEHMRAEGLNVEIINISYSGWSTSQQLEALEKEGMKYGPDLIITHFVPNDINENFAHTGSGKFANRIPFYHEVNSDGDLVRRDNPNFAKERDAITRKYILSKSEVLKMFWILHQSRKHTEEPAHKFTKGKIHQMELLWGKSIPERFRSEINKIVDIGMDATKLNKFLDGFVLDKKMREAVTLITENRDTQRDFHGNGNFGGPKVGDRNWPLYFQIMKRIKAVAQNSGAQVAISSDQGLGRYNYERYWYRIPEGERGKRFFFLINDRLKEFTNKLGIGFVKPLRPAERARNDPHLNENGNWATAMNIYDYLMRNYGEEIRRR